MFNMRENLSPSMLYFDKIIIAYVHFLNLDVN